MIGLGYRREMNSWAMAEVAADFHEVVPENWLRRDIAPLLQLRALGRPVHLHGVSLNLGGTSAIDPEFIGGIRRLMDSLGDCYYSDHLAASGCAHQLYDLFPIPFTPAEIARVSDRIKAVQDLLGRTMAIENSTWYTNWGEIPEPEFINEILHRADCQLLLDLNNVCVNYKNHQLVSLTDFVARIDLSRVSYIHVAGHEFDARFDMYIDTHSQGVEPDARAMAQQLRQQRGIPVLLEWDNDVPDLNRVNEELRCLDSTITCAA
jgi:uncharacterized protein